MAQIDSAAQARLKAIVDGGVQLPTLPSIASELLSLAHQRQDRIDIQKVAALIESDPALAARLLRMANSPYFGVTRGVTSVSHAIMLIGLDETIGFLNFHLLTHVMNACPKMARFQVEAFWTHSWATGTAARMFGRPQYLVKTLPGELYLAGLFHDIGKIVLASHMTADFAKALDLAHETGIPLWQAEREVIGIDHAMLGAQLLDRWNLPASILAAVGAHHDPSGAAEEHREIAALTDLADRIINRYEIGDGGSPGNAEISQAWILQEGRSPLASPQIQETLFAEVIETLQKKSDLISSGDAKAEGESEKPAATKPAPRERAAAPAGAASNGGGGLWGRVRTGFSSIFS